ncbi:MAG: hypothetical protein AAF416_05895 [Pseudomonadota bacterium]
MLINEYLSVGEAWAVTAVILGTVFLVLIASGVFVGWTARSMPEDEDRRGIVLVPLLLIFWAASALATSLTVSLAFVWFLPFVLIPVFVGTALSFWRPLVAILRHTPTQWMIGLQTYRVVGMIFLFPMYTSGVLSAGFAFPAAIGDLITGLAAPYVAWRVARDAEGAGALFVAWTIFGIADLIIAPVSAALWGFGADDRDLSFAITAIPLFLGPPFGILIHVLTWRSYMLRRRARATERAPG